MTASARPDFSSFDRSIEVDRLTTDEPTINVDANTDDLASLAAFLAIPAVDALSGEVQLSRHGSLVHVHGSIQAKLTRECVVSLEPLDEKIDETFDETYTTEWENRPVPEEVEADLNAPEPIEDGRLSLAHILIEQLVLAMEPHPRKEGATPIEDPGAGATISPFAELAKLKTENK